MPNAGFAGNEFVTYVVVSDGVGTATATLAIEVQNRSPTAVNDNYSVHSAIPSRFAAGASVLSNDNDGDGDPFSVLSHGAAITARSASAPTAPSAYRRTRASRAMNS